MSNSTKDKLINIEAMPPATVWEKIAAALDESHLENKFPNTLHQASAEVPGQVWSAISDHLNNESAYQKINKKLYLVESNPPLVAWQNIVAGLADGQQKAAPIKRLSQFVRYAVAAAIISFVAFGAFKLVNQKNNNHSTTNNNNTTSNTEVAIQKSESLSTTSDSQRANINLSNPELIVLGENKSVYAALNIANKLKKSTHNFAASPETTITIYDGTTPANTYKDLNCTEFHALPSINEPIDQANRYTFYQMTDGRIVRISKKLGDLACCVSGEEQGFDCKEQLEKWRTKLANAPVNPSPENFMGILDLLHSLKEGSSL